jgi:hypothetical protein
MVLNQTEHGWLSGRHREQAHSYNWIVYIRAETSWLSGRLREQARLLQKQDQKIAAFGSSYMESWRTRTHNQAECQLACF